MKKPELKRRDFLKMGGLALGGLALKPWQDNLLAPEYVGESGMLGRVTLDRIRIRSGPSTNAEQVGELREDQVLPWLREVVGYVENHPNQRWVETPLGYVWSPFLQKTYSVINTPITALPNTAAGPGMWVQTTEPVVNVQLENLVAYMPLTQRQMGTFGGPRVYYSQIFWVDQTRVDNNGKVWYRLTEIVGNAGDVFWGPAEAFRPMTAEEVAPISPEVTGGDKYIEVNLRLQTLSAYEYGREVFFARVSTGRLDAETPTGNNFYPRQKSISARLGGANAGAAWDLGGIGFTTLFIGSGVALHSTFWHNQY